MKKIFVLISLLLLPITGLQAQMLAFNIEAPPELTVTVMSDGVLDFGSLLQNQGNTQIQLEDAQTEIISIEGAHNRDLRVTIYPPAALQLDANNDLPYTLGAAYANEGKDNKNQATEFSGNTATFPVYQSEGGGPPPWAGGGKKGGGTPTANAYLYIYGDITVGQVRAGTYAGTINISVEYD
jgi:spore coat protein U-like protein